MAGTTEQGWMEWMEIRPVDESAAENQVPQSWPPSQPSTSTSPLPETNVTVDRRWRVGPRTTLGRFPHVGAIMKDGARVSGMHIDVASSLLGASFNRLFANAMLAAPSNDGATSMFVPPPPTPSCTSIHAGDTLVEPNL